MMQAAILDRDWKTSYLEVRKMTEKLCEPLEPEDYVPQPIEDVSPPKWHLGHTTWFFETFLLQGFAEGYQAYHKDFSYVFNSYYESVGERVVRSNRGGLSRPSTEEVYAYREHVDEQMCRLIEAGLSDDGYQFLEIGINHEQQHQELLVTDLKYIMGSNPLLPEYHHTLGETVGSGGQREAGWLRVEEGLYTVGFEGEGFCWDNERAAHKVFLEGFSAMDRLVTNAEFVEFMEAGGYRKFEYWLSEGWEWVKANQIAAPLYWYRQQGKWMQYTLGGGREVDGSAPVTHISFFEAEAFARWKGMRLLTEFEWEVLCQQYGNMDAAEGCFLERMLFQPQTAKAQDYQLLGHCWEWTNSSYLPYPRYKQEEGALGEYNGKFMVNQMVLRGGSCATPANHIRPTYRNFFQTEARWQFTGIRLANKQS